MASAPRYRCSSRAPRRQACTCHERLLPAHCGHKKASGNNEHKKATGNNYVTPMPARRRRRPGRGKPASGPGRPAGHRGGRCAAPLAVTSMGLTGQNAHRSTTGAVAWPPAEPSRPATSHRVRTATGLIHLWHHGAESRPYSPIGDGHFTDAESRARARRTGLPRPSRPGMPPRIRSGARRPSPLRYPGRPDAGPG